MAVEAVRGAVVEQDSDTGRRGRPVAAPVLKIVLWLLASAYLLTSVVVVVNAFTWLPGMPAAWYTVQRALYWPFQPYFKLLGWLLGSPSISYGTFAVVSRAPFFLGALAIMVYLSRKKANKKGAEAPSKRHSGP